MRPRILIAAELTIALSLTVIVIVTLSVHGTQHAPFDKQIPVAVEQLPLVDGVLPVEVRCGVAQLTAPGALESFSCMAINNTKKNIVSLAATYTIITEKDGEGESLNTSVLTVDSLLHPDIRSARGLKMIRPGAMHPVHPPGPVSYEGETIARVELSIDYVEFEDDTSLGPDKHGSRAIGSMREGAALYKSWFIKKYKHNKRNANAVTPVLDELELPAELRVSGDGDLSEGARMYRRFLLDVYRNHGAVELKKYLDK